MADVYTPEDDYKRRRDERRMTEDFDRWEDNRRRNGGRGGSEGVPVICCQI